MIPPPHPKARAFGLELTALLVKHTDNLTEDGEDRIIGVSILGLLFSTACRGCAESGVPLSLAMELLGDAYGANIITHDVTSTKGPQS